MEWEKRCFEEKNEKLITNGTKEKTTTFKCLIQGFLNTDQLSKGRLSAVCFESKSKQTAAKLKTAEGDTNSCFKIKDKKDF